MVIAIIALLIGILLPALGQARSAARNVVSSANLRSLTQVQLTYTLDYDDSFHNPFPTTAGQLDELRSIVGGTRGWGTVFFPESAGFGQSWLLEFGGIGPYYGEAYALYWYSILARSYIGQSEWASDVQYSPNDTFVIDRVEEIRAEGAAFDFATTWDTSYLYSPTMWHKPSRYRPQSPMLRLPPRRSGPSNWDAGSPWVGSVAVSQSRTPSSKVILFERFDFSQRDRNETQGVNASGAVSKSKAPPQWNNPDAVPHVATVDGSVTKYPIAEIYETLEGESSFLPTALTPYVPWDMWQPTGPQLGLDTFDETVQDDPWEWGAGGGAYPALFWATINGAQGRDLVR